MNLRFTHALFITSLFVLTNQARAALPQAERDALLALYMATAGDHWVNHTGWNGVEGTECSWYGVSCNTDQTTVTGLDLMANNLKGAMPAELKNLTNLNSSDFRYNGVYSEDQGLIDFLDASNSPGSLQDTQTLDAGNARLASMGETRVDLSWEQTLFKQAGGYRIYVSEQSDADYVLFEDIPDKQTSMTTLPGLTACTQYHARIHSYTLAHADNPNEISSDGKRGKVISFVPNWDTGCIPDLTGGDVSIEFYEDTEKGTTTVTVKVDNNVPLIYLLSTTDLVLKLPNINVMNSVSITSNSSIDVNGFIIVNQNTDNNGSVTISAGSEFSITDLNSFDIDQTVTLDGNNDPLVYDVGYMAITRGVGTYDLAEDTSVDSAVTTVKIEFLGRDAFAGQMVYRLSAGNEAGVFAIDDKGGEITLVKPLDFEDVAQYQLEVSASDGEANYTGRITVNVTDVSETDTAGGCSLRAGAPFDPVWLFMLALAGLYRLRRSPGLK